MIADGRLSRSDRTTARPASSTPSHWIRALRSRSATGSPAWPSSPAATSSSPATRRIPPARRRRLGPGTVADPRTQGRDQHAEHQRRRAAYGHRKRGQPALLGVAREAVPRVAAQVQALPGGRAAAPGRPPGRGRALEQARAVGRSHQAPRSQRRHGARHRQHALLAQCSTNRALRLRRSTGVVHGGLDPGHTRVHRPRRAIIWVAISRDDRTLITGGLDGTIRLWDIESDEAVAALPGLRGHVAIGLPAPDGDLIAGYDTGLAFRWDIRPRRSSAKRADRRPHPDARGVGRVPTWPRARAGLQALDTLQDAKRRVRTRPGSAVSGTAHIFPSAAARWP